MQEDEEKLYRCISTSDSLHVSRGDSCLMTFTKARVLESMGAVRIVDDPADAPRIGPPDDDYLFRSRFGKRSGTRVAWIQNYSKNGGAEISNYNCIAVGRDLGFDVVGVVSNSLRGFGLCKDADVIVVNNLHSGNRDEIFDYLGRTTVPWIKYEHDLQETEFDLYKKSRLNVFISPLQKKLLLAARDRLIMPVLSVEMNISEGSVRHGKMSLMTSLMNLKRDYLTPKRRRKI